MWKSLPLWRVLWQKKLYCVKVQNKRRYLHWRSFGPGTASLGKLAKNTSVLLLTRRITETKENLCRKVSVRSASCRICICHLIHKFIWKPQDSCGKNDPARKTNWTFCVVQHWRLLFLLWLHLEFRTGKPSLKQFPAILYHRCFQLCLCKYVLFHSRRSDGAKVI